jgi:hypothetical protein
LIVPAVCLSCQLWEMSAGNKELLYLRFEILNTIHSYKNADFHARAGLLELPSNSLLQK